MKRSIFLSIILSLFLVACIPQAMAQKQSRLEKLLRYLNDNDADKWQKNRDKIDDETQTYYAEELALLDVLNGLWNEQSEQAAAEEERSKSQGPEGLARMGGNRLDKHGGTLGSITEVEWGNITIRASAQTLEYQGDGTSSSHIDPIILLSF